MWSVYCTEYRSAIILTLASNLRGPMFKSYLKKGGLLRFRNYILFILPFNNAVSTTRGENMMCVVRSEDE
jgi:hypothetical protein